MKDAGFFKGLEGGRGEGNEEGGCVFDLDVDLCNPVAFLCACFDPSVESIVLVN